MKIKPPRHLVWSTDTVDLSDPFQRKWYIRQVLLHGRSEDIRQLALHEVADLLEELNLPYHIYSLWKAFLEEQGYINSGSKMVSVKLNRRQFVAGLAGMVSAVGIGETMKETGENSASGNEQGVTAKAKSSSKDTLRCLPVISGALRQYNPAFSAKEGIDGWKRELDDERAVGFDLLWLANVPSALSANGREDPLKELLDLCADRKVQVILDTGSTGHWYSPLDIDSERKVVGGYIEEIARRYKDHPAFYAWYVPHEIYVAWDRMGKYIDDLYPSLVEMCRKAVPDKPVTLSPFFILDKDKVFGNFRYASPEEYREYWTGLIKRSGFDIIMLQDSGEHFSYVTDEQRRPFFEAMLSACSAGGARLWGNVETAEFECPGIEEYIRRYGRVHHSTVRNAPWRPVPIERLESKLRLAARYSERIVTWGYNEFGRPHLGPKAAEWYENYRHYYERVTGK